MQIQIATAPVSWGVLMKDTPNVPPYQVVLDQIRKAGYHGTELGPYGYLPFDIPQLTDELASRSLSLISAFIISSSFSTIFLSIPSLSIARGLEAAICIANFEPKSSYLPFEAPSSFTTEIILPILSL